MQRRETTQILSENSCRDIQPPQKSFLRTSEFLTRKSHQTDTKNNKENGNHATLDEEWVKAFDRKSSYSKADDNRQSILLKEVKQFKYSYLDFKQNEKPTSTKDYTCKVIPSQLQSKEVSVYVEYQPKQKQADYYNFRFQSREDSKDAKEIVKPDTPNYYSYKQDIGAVRLGQSVQANKQSQKLDKPSETPSPKASSILQMMSQIRQFQGESSRQNNVREEKQQKSSIQALTIPKSYLELAKTAGQRTQSEKSFHQTEIYQPKMEQKVEKKPKAPISFQYYISTVIGAFSSRESNPIHDIAKDHLQQMVLGVKFAMNQSAPDIHKSQKIFLPPSTKRTIIFDLDETLIHCNADNKKASDMVLPIIFPNGEFMEASINIRPYATYVLSNLAKHFELIIFTASQSCYANKIIDYLDPKNNLISHRFYREHCIEVQEGIYVKDLRILGNRSLNDILIVDNSAYSFAFQVDNGIPILPYFNNKNDEVFQIIIRKQLRYLQQYLMLFKDVKDVRNLNSDRLKVHSYGSYVDAVDLLKSEFSHLIE